MLNAVQEALLASHTVTVQQILTVKTVELVAADPVEHDSSQNCYCQEGGYISVLRDLEIPPNKISLSEENCKADT